MPFKTVLLDAGGIIVDEAEQEEARAEVIVEVLRTVVSGFCKDDYYSDVEEAVRCYCPGVGPYVVWKYAGGDSVKFNRLWDGFNSRWKEARPPVRLSAGIDREIRKLVRHFDLAIAGQYGAEILDALSRHDLLDCFVHRITQDDFSITKPDPRYYEQILARIGANANESVMVGDRIDKDVIPAKQVGMKAVLVRVGIHKNQQPRMPTEVPDIELGSVVGLSEAIFRMAEAE